jgi:hypothetical protein
MFAAGTRLARSPSMNDRPLSPAPQLLSQPIAQPPLTPAPADDEVRRDEDDDGLDKYDISTLACTD